MKNSPQEGEWRIAKVQLQKGNFVDGRNKSKYRDVAPLKQEAFSVSENKLLFNAYNTGQ